jgi:hypothetical protein
MGDGAHLLTGMHAPSIAVDARCVIVGNAVTYEYQRLISPIPLPRSFRMFAAVPDSAREVAARLDCSQVLLVDVFAPKALEREYSWD